MLTPMVKIERGRQGLLVDAVAAKTRIKEISRVFSLIALVRQQGSRIKMKPLVECMLAVGMQKPGEKETVEALLYSAGNESKTQSVGDVFRGKVEIIRPHLHREHRQLRRDVQVAYRHARALRKLAKGYVFRPGVAEN